MSTQQQQETLQSILQRIQVHVTQLGIYKILEKKYQETHQQQQQIFQFKHPFTANVLGPTSYGKTYFVKLLLQNCVTKIAPPP